MNTKTKVYIKLLEYFVVVVIIAGFYYLEIKTLDLIVEGHQNGIEKVIHQYLYSMQRILYPIKLWIMPLPLLIVSAIYLIFKNIEKRLAVLIIGFCLYAGVLYANYIYHLFFQTVIPFSSFKLIGQLFDIAGSVKGFVAKYFFVLIMIFTFTIILWIKLKSSKIHLINENFKFFLLDKVFAILLFALALLSFRIAFYFPAHYVRLDSLTKSLKISDQRIADAGYTAVPLYESSHKDYATTFGLSNFYLKELIGSVQSRTERKNISDADVGNIIRVLQDKKKINDQKAVLFGVAKNRNLIFISLESFHPLLVNRAVDGELIAPTLSKLANENLYWRNIICQNKRGGTSDAEFMLMTGLMPNTADISASGISQSDQFFKFPKYLQQSGYETHTFHGNDASFWNRSVNHPIFGIDNLHFQDWFPGGSSLGMGVPDDVLFKSTAEYLKEMEDKYFAYIITLSNHHPYKNVPGSYETLFPSLKNEYDELRRYYQLVRYTDDALKNFLDLLKEAGSLHDSMIVLFGDHLPPLSVKSKQGLIGRAVDGWPTRYITVPLIVALPGSENTQKAVTDDAMYNVGSLYDVAPTILHLLGEEIPYGMYGVNLLLPEETRGVVPICLNPNVAVNNGTAYSMFAMSAEIDEEGTVFHGNTDSVPIARSTVAKIIFRARDEYNTMRLMHKYRLYMTQ